MSPPFPTRFKIPRSALVVIHTAGLEVLLLERADHPGYWQSVTGSQDDGETPLDTAMREVREETGIEAARERFCDWNKQVVYEIFPQWRHRYAPGTTHNTEHVFSLEVPASAHVQLNVREHLRHQWLAAPEAAQRCFSWSNREAILELAERVARR
jgi:dATP pyrophosphohydrolase